MNAEDPVEDFLEAVTNARLPDNYVAATTALAECARVDECLEWVEDEALAAYARMADNVELENDALRIRARARRRMGELVSQFKSKGGRPRQTDDGTVSSFSQKSVADAAGLSDRLRVTCLRIARIPEADFEAAVESARPPGTEMLLAMERAARTRTPPTETVTAATIADLRERMASKAVIDALMTIEHNASSVDPSAVVALLLDPKNVTKVTSANIALSFLARLKAEMDRAAPSRPPNLRPV